MCNVARADDYFVMNALEPIQHTPAKTAPIFAHSGERLLSIVEPGELGIPVLKHLHHTWPHYVTVAPSPLQPDHLVALTFQIHPLRSHSRPLPPILPYPSHADL